MVSILPRMVVVQHDPLRGLVAESLRHFVDVEPAVLQGVRGPGMARTVRILPMNCPRRRIWYRYHPFFGHEVRVVRRFRRVSADSLIVELPDGLQLAVPPWMLDPIACAPLCVMPLPRISLTALATNCGPASTPRPWCMAPCRPTLGHRPTRRGPCTSRGFRPVNANSLTRPRTSVAQTVGSRPSGPLPRSARPTPPGRPASRGGRKADS